MALGVGDGCYRGGERDKDPPPGLPGGLCLAPDGHCEAGVCNRDQNFCYDPTDPCDGFFCGGSERGFCFPDPATLQPSCMCELGFNNSQYELYCCPDAAIGMVDPNCTAPPSDDGTPATDDGPAGSSGVTGTMESSGGAMTGSGTG